MKPVTLFSLPFRTARRDWAEFRHTTSAAEADIVAGVSSGRCVIESRQGADRAAYEAKQPARALVEPDKEILGGSTI